jgi:hypothetical protein
MTPNEYRKKLHTKLTTLIAVLIVAIKKIEKGMSMPEANVERMRKIRDNLANTLGICERAQLTLAAQNALGGSAPMQSAPSGAREYTEMSSVAEYRKFAALPPITSDDIESVNWDQLQDEFKKL